MRGGAENARRETSRIYDGFSINALHTSQNDAAARREHREASARRARHRNSYRAAAAAGKHTRDTRDAVSKQIGRANGLACPAPSVIRIYHTHTYTYLYIQTCDYVPVWISAQYSRWICVNASREQLAHHNLFNAHERARATARWGMREVCVVHIKGQIIAPHAHTHTHMYFETGCRRRCP